MATLTTTAFDAVTDETKLADLESGLRAYARYVQALRERARSRKVGGPQDTAERNVSDARLALRGLSW